ncbi:MAG: hypothetical protein MJ132_02440 [Clostridia bacterium]|nr:hypothetical protein [Clostridia bacterium]
MTDTFQNRQIGLMMLLKSLGVDKFSTMGIAASMKTDEEILEIAERLKAKDFKTTPQETLNICGQVITEHLNK